MTFFFRLIFMCCLLGFRALNGQNLVPNPSFEDTVMCPIGLAFFNSALGWSSPTTATPDHFHMCNLGNVGVPQNAFGYQMARSGQAYAGFHTSDFSVGNNNYREYIQCQLLSPLETSEQYEIRLYVSRADSSTKASDSVGAYLSEFAISSNDNLNLNYVPQTVSTPGIPIVNDTNWTIIVDTISAIGNEQFLTIGVFATNSELNWIDVEGGWENEAHYYVDDVSVKKIVIDALSEEAFSVVNIYPNPSSDQLFIKSIEVLNSYKLYNSIAQIVSKSDGLFGFETCINVSNFNSGLYLLEIQTSNFLLKEKVIVK